MSNLVDKLQDAPTCADALKSLVGQHIEIMDIAYLSKIAGALKVVASQKDYLVLERTYIGNGGQPEQILHPVGGMVAYRIKEK